VVGGVAHRGPDVVRALRPDDEVRAVRVRGLVSGELAVEPAVLGPEHRPLHVLDRVHDTDAMTRSGQDRSGRRLGRFA
jgi:hypothetical protein